MRQAGEATLDAIDDFPSAHIITFLKTNSVDIRQNLDAQRRYGKPDELACCQKGFRWLLSHREPKLLSSGVKN